MKPRPMPMRALPAAMLAATLLLAGCAATPSKVDPLEPMNRAMEGMGGEVVKRYRIYELPLSG